MLISRDDIARYYQISASVHPEHINRYIQAAERQDVTPLTGIPLYLKVTNDTAGNKPLLEYYEYTDSRGNRDFNEGLKKVVASFAYARYKFFGDDNDGPHGTGTYTPTFMQPVSRDRRGELYTAFRKEALHSWQSVHRFLLEHKNDYPEYTGSCGVKKFSNIKYIGN